MCYKTILVHADGSPHMETRVALAAQLAQQHGAHLVGAAFTGMSRFFYQDGSADLARTMLAPYMDGLFEKTERELDAFRRLAAAASPPSWEGRLMDDEAGAGLALAARYADLVVLGQREPGAPAPIPGGDLAAYLLLACPRPLLVVPYVQCPVTAGRNILVGWNGSVEAVRAITAALPLLRRADTVTVAASGTPDDAGEGTAGLGAYLARHGIRAHLLQEPAGVDAGEGLLSLLADLDADLLVMGGYGHARLRELVLGGATRTILHAMTVPVLMTH